MELNGTEPYEGKHGSSDLQEDVTSDEVLDSELELDNFQDGDELEDFESSELEEEELEDEQDIERELELRKNEIETIDGNNGIDDLVESEIEPNELLDDANELSDGETFHSEFSNVKQNEEKYSEQLYDKEEASEEQTNSLNNEELIVDPNNGESGKNDGDYVSLVGPVPEGRPEVSAGTIKAVDIESSGSKKTPVRTTPIVIYIDITEFLLCPHDSPELTHLVSLYDDYSILDCTLESFFNKIRSNQDLSEIHTFIPDEELILSIPELTEVSIAEDDIHLQNLRLLELISTYEKWCTCSMEDGPKVLTLRISFLKRFISEFSRVLKEIRLGQHCKGHHAKRRHDGEELERKRSK